MSEVGSKQSAPKADGSNVEPEFGQPIQEAATAEETKYSQVDDSEANPTASSQSGSAKDKQDAEKEGDQAEEEAEAEGPVSPKAEEGETEEQGPPKAATGQEEEGPEATGVPLQPLFPAACMQ